jgi:hypothetical protein
MVLLALNDVGDHFTHPRGQWTWSQVREGHYICSKTDYIMAQEILDFKRWAIKIPWFNMDPRAIITEIRLGKMYAHRSYVSCR